MKDSNDGGKTDVKAFGVDSTQEITWFENIGPYLPSTRTMTFALPASLSATLFCAASRLLLSGPRSIWTTLPLAPRTSFILCTELNRLGSTLEECTFFSLWRQLLSGMRETTESSTTKDGPRPISEGICHNSFRLGSTGQNSRLTRMLLRDGCISWANLAL